MWIGGSTLGTVVAVAFFRPSGFDLGLLACFYFASNLGVSVGFHRLLSHRSFSCPVPVRYLLLIMGCFAAQGPPGYWAILHRRHHRFSDRDGDPHSPVARRSGGPWRAVAHAHMGWINEVGMPRPDRHSKDLIQDPVIRRVGKMYYAIAIAGIALPALFGWIHLNSVDGAVHGMLWGGAVRLFLVHHTIWSINSVCHLWGAQHYATGDASRNNWLLSIVSVGESWHNNHHAAAGSARFGHRWWQVDLGYALIRLFVFVGLAEQPRPPPLDAIRSIRLHKTSIRTNNT